MLITLEAAKSLLRIYDDTEDGDIQSLIASCAAYLKNATGRDWHAEEKPDPIAAHCMRAMLVQLYDQRDGESTSAKKTLGLAVNNWITQLQVLAATGEEGDADGGVGDAGADAD